MEKSKRKTISTDPNIRFASKSSLKNCTTKNHKNSKIKEQLFRALSTINKEINMSIDTKDKLKGPLPSLEFFINKPSSSANNFSKPENELSSCNLTRKNSKLVELNINFLNNIASISQKQLNNEKFSSKFVNQKGSKNEINFINPKMQDVNSEIELLSSKKDYEELVKILSNNNILSYSHPGQGKFYIHDLNIKKILTFYAKKLFELSQIKSETDKNKLTLSSNENQMDEYKDKIKKINEKIQNENDIINNEHINQEEANLMKEATITNHLLNEENINLQLELKKIQNSKKELIHKYSEDLQEYQKLFESLKNINKS